MTSFIDCKNPSARALLKWAANSVNKPAVTEVLRKKVYKISCEGDSDCFQMTLHVQGENAKKILEMNMERLHLTLHEGFREQASVELEGISFVLQ